MQRHAKNVHGLTTIEANSLVEPKIGKKKRKRDDRKKRDRKNKASRRAKSETETSSDDETPPNQSTDILQESMHDLISVISPKNYKKLKTNILSY